MTRALPVTDSAPISRPKSAAAKPRARAGVMGVALSALTLSGVAPLAAVVEHRSLEQLLSAYQSQGLKINRLGKGLENDNDALDSMQDWSAFQDFKSVREPGAALAAEQTTHQISLGRHGFSIALEAPGEGDDSNRLRTLTDASPNLILSWHGETDFAAGQYEISATGRRIALNGEYNGIEVDDDELGWGLKLVGGWWFGKFFTSLNVTISDGIDRFILRRFGRDIAVLPSGRIKTMESLSILPSLSYRFGQYSNFHIALGHHVSEDGEGEDSASTLDTISLGYTWSPWPAAKIGIQLQSVDIDGGVEDSELREVKIGAEQRF